MQEIKAYEHRYGVLEQFGKLTVYDLETEQPFLTRYDAKGFSGVKLHKSAANSQNVALVFMNGRYKAHMDFATASILAERAGVKVFVRAIPNPWKSKAIDEKDIVDATVRMLKARGCDKELFETLIDKIKNEL